MVNTPAHPEVYTVQSVAIDHNVIKLRGMALPSVLHRFRLKLSDVDRGLYENFELRIARHPSEGDAYLLTRVIAYCLNLQEGLEVTPGGVSSTEEPALSVKDLTGTCLLWIEVGNPAARRLHKASKASQKVRIYTYRDPAILLKELEGETIHRRDEIEIFSLPPSGLSALARTLERDNDWELLHTDGELTITTKQGVVAFEIRALH